MADLKETINDKYARNLVSPRFRLTVSLVLYRQTYAEISELVDTIVNSPLVGRLYIMDNSGTGSLSNYFQDKSKIKYRLSPLNLGFGNMHNEAMKHTVDSNGEDYACYHLIVNPDVKFETSVLTELVDYMDAHEEVGLITPKIFYPDGTLQFHCKLLPTPWVWLVRGFSPFKSLKDKVNQLFELHAFDYNHILNVPYLNGSFMLFRSEALQKEPYFFDPAYFMYSEDTDITRRIHRSYQTLFYPNVSIIHAWNRESHRNIHLFWIQIKSTIRYFNKWGWLKDKERDLFNKQVKDILSQ